MSIEQLTEATESTSSVFENTDFDPDERINKPDSKESSYNYNPDNHVDCYEIKSGDYSAEKEYDPDDRIKVYYDKGVNEDSKCKNSAEDTGLEHPDSNNEKNEANENLHKETVDGKTYYYDDNGNLYRIDNDLLPNSEYEMNGYKYQTDDQCRITSAEGTLHLKEREGRLPIKDSIEDIGKGDQKEGDDRGHLIGDQFDGSNGLENMVPQDANINRNDFKNFENELAKSVKEGNEVTVKVEPIYDDSSKRPSDILVTYTIDGEESVRIFPNDSED